MSPSQERRWLISCWEAFLPIDWSCSTLGIAEVVSVLVRRKNAGRLSAASFSQAIVQLGHEIIQKRSIVKVEPTNALVISALNQIQKHSINATDAVVLHAALGLANYLRSIGNDLVLFASDQRLLRAAQVEGLATFNPETQDQSALAVLVGP